MFISKLILPTFVVSFHLKIPNYFYDLLNAFYYVWEVLSLLNLSTRTHSLSLGYDEATCYFNFRVIDHITGAIGVASKMLSSVYSVLIHPS